MKLKKVTAAIMSSVIALGMFSGCSQAPKNGEGNEQVTIRVGSWPSEEDKENYARQEAIKENFEKEYPNIKVEGDTWGFDLDTFLPKAASGQLPDIYVTSLTEIQRIIQTGYASDVTTAMEQYKYTDYLRDDIIDCISDDSGKIYAIPSNAYTMSLMINLNLFREAGLLKEDSTPMIPETWEQVAEYAQTIKQKTGQAGFSMSTMNNVGGWHFLNIAWAYGVTPEFAKQENGKWTADFATPEGVAALQFVKDLKWKYNAVSENALLDFEEMYKMFATDRTAMMMAAPPLDILVDRYGMKNTDIAVASMPAGPSGKFTQAGAELYVLKNGLSDEQIDACFKWLEFNGITPEISEERKENIESAYKIKYDNNNLIGINNYSMWKSDNVPPVQKFENEIIEKYTNVDKSMFADYENSFDTTDILPEPPISCQQLYSLLDGCIQKVWTDEQADPLAVLEKASNDYQVNYLDKAE